MSEPFNARGGLIHVLAKATGPAGTAVLTLGLDTGAVYTLLNEAVLVKLGYDPAQATTQLPITTASAVVVVPVIPLLKLTALGLDRVGFGILCHTLPPSATVDGLLGLDFFRGRILTLDFQAGQITLT